VKVTVQYYADHEKAKKAETRPAIKQLAEAQGLTVEAKDENMDYIEVDSLDTAKKLMAAVHKAQVPNVQIQTA
jgi:hypothetical protein